MRTTCTFLACSLLLVPLVMIGKEPTDESANKESLEAALRITRAAAAEYEFRVGESDDVPPLELKGEPVFRWSNPVVGDVHGNVFIWTHDARPQVVGSFFHWSLDRPTMEHEFHSLVQEPLVAHFHGEPVWTTDSAGLKFVEVSKAAVPSESEPQRVVQLKQLAKEFTGLGIFGKEGREQELRLLPQPLYRYTSRKHGVLTGGLFAFVRATDPEILLLLEARRGGTATTWQYAAIRMHSTAQLRLRRNDDDVWHSHPQQLKDIYEQHQSPYTSFKFKDVPEFLRDRQ